MKVVETLIYMGLIEPVADMTAVKRMISFMIEEFRDKPVDVRAFEQITEEVYAIFEQQPFRLPPQMTFVVKSLTTLDGNRSCFRSAVQSPRRCPTVSQTNCFSTAAGQYARYFRRDKQKTLFNTRFDSPTVLKLQLCAWSPVWIWVSYRLRLNPLKASARSGQIQLGIKKLNLHLSIWI